jgi:hypothetical protein
MHRRTRTALVTTNPDPAPLQLFCPACHRSLLYRQTVIGGVQPIERWDYFECLACGPFQYRLRTRKLRESPQAGESTTTRDSPKV